VAVLEPNELEQSPLADLHALAAELGIEGYRRLRREELIAAIAGQGAAGAPAGAGADAEPSPAAGTEESEGSGDAAEPTESAAEGEGAPRRRRRGRRRADEDRSADREPEEPEAPEEVRSGVLDVLPNGSGFVRSDPFAHSTDDVYVSPAQIRRCELRTGDEVAGPVRAPRRSERYPSLVRVDTVNGAPAEPPPERPLLGELTARFSREKLEAPAELEAAPFGKGSRVAVTGPPGAGSTTLLRRIAAVLAERHPDLDLVVVLAGARPEEVGEWRSELSVPIVGGSFDRSPERQGDAASMAVERAKRRAERGEHAAVIVDSLELLPGAAARRVFGAARDTEEAGSVTVIAATGIGPEPARHATTRIVLRPGGEPGAIEVDADSSGTLRAELLS
jgi:transcription termination factor Rho